MPVRLDPELKRAVETRAKDAETKVSEPRAGLTQVEVEEYPVEGPAAKVWNRALDGIFWLRNAELLRR